MNKGLTITDLTSGEILYSIPNVIANTISYSLDGNYLAFVSTNNSYLYLFDSKTGKLIKKINTSCNDVTKIFFSSDNTKIYLSGSNNFIVFDLLGEKILNTFPPKNNLVFNDDGTKIIYMDGYNIIVQETNGWKVIDEKIFSKSYPQPEAIFDYDNSKIFICSFYAILLNYPIFTKDGKFLFYTDDNYSDYDLHVNYVTRIGDQYNLQKIKANYNVRIISNYFTLDGIGKCASLSSGKFYEIHFVWE